MPTPQTGRITKQTSPAASPAKAVNKAAIARAFDDKSPTVKDRVRQWQEQGGGVKTAPEVFAESATSQGATTTKSTGTSSPSSRKAASEKSKATNVSTTNRTPASDKKLTDGKPDASEPKKVDETLKPDPATPTKAAKKRDVSAARLRLAQAIVGPTVRPSERLRRLSEARREAEAKREADARKEAQAIKEAQAKAEAEAEKKAEAQRKAEAKKKALAAALARQSKLEPVEKPQEAATPKKRVISDGHWRSKRTPPEETAIPNPPPKPTVEGWLNNVPTEERIFAEDQGATEERVCMPDDGIRVTPMSEADSQQERERRHDERRRKRRERVEARRAAYGRSTSSNPAADHGAPGSSLRKQEDETRSQPGETVPSISSSASPTERSTGVSHSNHLRTHSAPTSVAPSNSAFLRPGGRVNVPSAATPPESHLSYSSQDDSDNLTSISRRRPTNRSRGSKQKKNIFAHAAKIFSKPEPKIDIVPNIPPGTARVPTIESWLDHAGDPFSSDGQKQSIDIPLPLNVKSREALPNKKAQSKTESRREDARSIDESPPSQAKASNSGVTRDNVVTTDFDESNKKKRLRRVIHHRDGTVTTEDVEEAVDVPDSPTLRRRGAQRQGSPRAQGYTISHTNRLPRHTSRRPDSLAPTDFDSVLDADDDIPEDLSFVGRTRKPLTKSDRDWKQDRGEPPQPFSRTRKQTSSRGQRDNAVGSNDRVGRSGSRNSRLAKHSDLISVLSNPKHSGASIRSARSIRTYRSRLETATINDILNEFSTDEAKYMRELYTLVDGVIPVLLSNSLSSKSSLVTSKLFQSNLPGDSEESVAKPIFDMGIALEKLKVHHGKAPSTDSGALITWAKKGARLYTEYLQAWRAGFQDVVVNLAAHDSNDEVEALDKGLPRDTNGDVIDSNGERVDVAFLLKRPLVRLKYLAKTMHGINHLQPSPQAEDLTKTFRGLVEHARKRSNEERSRLEDQTAAATDATKARDPRTLAPVEGVLVDSKRHVKARDTFVLNLRHSSGQRLDCTVEIALREDPPDIGNAGDLLIAEIDGTGRWLLFPPLHVDQLSARNGDAEGEIVLMIRGEDAESHTWHELMLLTSEEESVAPEWVQLLGLEPVPPAIHGAGSFATSSTRLPPKHGSEANAFSTAPTVLDAPAASTPTQIEVPIGERAHGNVRKWSDTSDSRIRKRHPRYSPSTIIEETPSAIEHSDEPLEAGIDTERRERLPRNLNEAMKLAGSPRSGLKRARAQRQSKYSEGLLSSPTTPDYPVDNAHTGRSSISPSPESQPSTPTRDTRPKDPGAEEKAADACSSAKKSDLPSRYHRSSSLTPDLQLPTISKRRTGGSPSRPNTELGSLKQQDQQNSSTGPLTANAQRLSGTPNLPPTPGQKTGSSGSEPASKNSRGHRRTSSPLKHEYAPSLASNSDDESDASTVVHDLSSLSDRSSSDSELEDSDTQSVLVPMSAIGRYRKAPRKTPPESLADGTLSPSQSASQAPYRDVPAQPGQGQKVVASLFIWSDKGSWQPLWPEDCLLVVTPGLIEAYERQTPPGRVMSSSPSPQSSNRKSPGFPTGQLLLGLELTPLVPIRRGTALDISIRSPPTPDSKATPSSNNNFLFRSATPEDCEILYSLINHSRINNPTYIALQNARATSFNPQFQGADQKNNSRLVKASSWFGLGRKNSYRASSVPTASVSKHTESSISSMGSALSAIRNLGRGAGRFNIARSTVTSRQGSGSNSMFTSSEGTGSTGTSTSSMFNGADGSLGINNCKIRLYLRESTSKWSDLGAAKLQILRPDSALPSGRGSPAPVVSGSPVPLEHASSENKPGHGVGMRSASGYASLGNKVTATDKRIVVLGLPKKGAMTDALQTLLDVTLGESCFEPVGKIGIAVSVWENFEGGMVAKQGGVNAGRVRVYMMQFGNEADSAYTYGILGRLRY